MCNKMTDISLQLYCETSLIKLSLPTFKMRSQPRFAFHIFLLACATVLSSCAFNKVLKKGTADEKLVAAKKYYAKKDYNRSMPLLDDLIGKHYRGADAEEVYYLYSKTFYGMQDYIMAGYHFKNFTETYPYSKYVEESAFLSAKCEYHKALPYYLDQGNTRKAIDRIQLFINKFPKSTYVEEGNKLIDDLRLSLHNKAYHMAMLYYNMESYKAAYVSCKNAIIDYPDIPQYTELEYIMVDAAYKYAAQSVVGVQAERFQLAIEEGKDFLKNHTETNLYYNEVKDLVDRSIIEKDFSEIRLAYNKAITHVKDAVSNYEETIRLGNAFLEQQGGGTKHKRDVEKMISEANRKLKIFREEVEVNKEQQD
ncbi:MAG: outer membrane protein assembly factor BamD [Bacteroidia bacterium]